MAGVKVTAKKTRLIKRDSWRPSSSITIDVNKDTVYLHWLWELFGSIQTTYLSGSPVADDTSIMARLCNFVKVDAGGDVILKNINPWFLHMQSIIAKGVFNNRLCEAAAAPLVVDDLDTDAKFVYGTTTQYTTFAEAVLISFENVLAGQGSKNTWFDARALPSLTLEFTTASYANLLEAGNGAPVVYDNDAITYRVSSIETQDVPQDIKFYIWKQTQKTVQTSAAGTTRYDIVKGNYLQGIGFLARSGAAGLPLSNSIVKEMALIINGDRYPKQTTFQQLQKTMREDYGINAPFVGGSSVLDGFVYMDLLVPIGNERLGSLDTAQSLLSPAVDTAQVELTYDSAGDFTSPAAVTMQFNEIIRPVGA